MADCFDVPFGDTVLVVGADAAEGEGLLVEGAFLFEGCGGEDAIVGVVALDFDVGFAGEGFEVAFALDGGGGVCAESLELAAISLAVQMLFIARHLHTATLPVHTAYERGFRV